MLGMDASIAVQSPLFSDVSGDPIVGPAHALGAVNAADSVIASRT